MIKGFDASSVQGEIPWASLGDYRFVILKSQQGNDGLDPEFAHDVAGAQAAGIEPFAYCFAYPLDHIDPKAQAKLFMDAVARGGLDIKRPVFVDCEWPEIGDWPKWGCTAKQITAYLERLFAELVALGARPCLYTYPVWWAAVSAADVSWAAAYPLWMAAYVRAPPGSAGPKVPHPWSTWTFWQWDGNGGQRLPNGVDTDFDLFNGDEEAFQLFIRGPRPPDSIEAPAASGTAT